MPAREGRTHYDVLGVARDASATEIRRAFQRLTLEHHPDRNRDDPTAGARMAEINAAYGVLRDQRRRRAYDASLSPQATSPNDSAASDEFSDAYAHWERADTEEQEWQAYVREVQAELKSWTDEHLHMFVREQGALADDAASFEERSMHQWFTAVALEEIRFREEQEAHAHWERADTEEQGWQAYVREVQTELKSWTDEHLHAFVLEHGALADDAASFEERSMHQWFAAVALEEIEFREEQAAQVRRRRGLERERRRQEQERAAQARREQLWRETQERTEQARREQLRREERERQEVRRSVSPPPVHDEAIEPPHTKERRPEGRARRVVRRLVARVGIALIVLLAQMAIVAELGGVNPDNPELASDGAAIGAGIWMLCAVFALALASLDAFERVTEAWRNRSLRVLAVLIVLSIVISTVGG